MKEKDMSSIQKSELDGDGLEHREGAEGAEPSLDKCLLAEKGGKNRKKKYRILRI